MAGHSKFKNIQYRKGAQDKKRAKMFSKLAKEITVAAKLGLPDPGMNPRLRSAIQAARAQNMPKDNIERAVKKSQDAGGANFDEVRYEGFGPGGTGFIIETLTDNKNRTAGDIRSIFTKCGGNLAETGSVSFLFTKVGLIEFDRSKSSEDEIIESSIDQGAEDCDISDDCYEIYCQPSDLHSLGEKLEKKFGDANLMKIIWKPENNVVIDQDTFTKIDRLIELLDDNDDVQDIYFNFDIPDDFIS